MIFQYNLEPILIQWILIGFKAILKYLFVQLKITFTGNMAQLIFKRFKKLIRIKGILKHDRQPDGQNNT